VVFKTLNIISIVQRCTVIISFDVTMTGSDTGTGQLFIILLKILQVRIFTLLLFFTFITITFF